MFAWLDLQRLKNQFRINSRKSAHWISLYSRRSWSYLQISFLLYCVAFASIMYRSILHLWDYSESVRWSYYFSFKSSILLDCNFRIRYYILHPVYASRMTLLNDMIQIIGISYISNLGVIRFFSHLVNKPNVFTFIRFICFYVSLFNFATWNSAKNAFHGITNLFLRFRFYSIQTLQAFVISILFYFCML